MFVAKKQAKRKFVTTYQPQQQHMNKKAIKADKAEKRNTRMFPLEGTRKSPRLNRVREITDDLLCEKTASARRKLDLQDPPHDDENMGENEVEVS